MSGAGEKMSETAEKLSDLQWKKRERMGVENREKNWRKEWKVELNKNDRKSEKYKEIKNFLRDIFLAKKKNKIVECSPN